MTGYLVGRQEDVRLPGGRRATSPVYLERRPVNDTYGFYAGTSTYATVFSEAVAKQVAAQIDPTWQTVFITEDVYYRRSPEVTSIPQQFRSEAA